MAKRRFNYDSDEFYNEILALALQGFTDKEIAFNLKEHFGKSLTTETFSAMKSGCYIGWTKAENAKYSERIKSTLERGRISIVQKLRTTYLRVALGSIKTKNVSRRLVQEKCECGGTNKKCPECGGEGWISISDKCEAQESIFESTPNLQALGNLLMHYDKNWKNAIDESEDIPSEIKNGINVENWIKEEVLKPVETKTKKTKKSKNTKNNKKGTKVKTDDNTAKNIS